MFKSLFAKGRKDSPPSLAAPSAVDSGIYEVISCPLCCSDQSTTFRNRADIVTCSSCGLVYLRTRPNAQEMYRIYQTYADGASHMKPPDDIAGAKQSGLRRKNLVDEIVKGHVGSKKGVWLDVGCGWGALLDEVRDRGFTPKGIELTRKNLDYAVMQLALPVSNSQLNDSSIPIGSCTVISMVHVFEHLPDPKKTLEKIHASLEEGGIFCGIVPNIASFCSEVQKDDWVWLDPTHHYVHYSSLTLTQALIGAGFTVEKIYTDGGDFDRDILKQCIIAEMPGAPSPKEIEQQLNTTGKGEEIRFFARKNK